MKKVLKTVAPLALVLMLAFLLTGCWYNNDVAEETLVENPTTVVEQTPAEQLAEEEALTEEITPAEEPVVEETATPAEETTEL